MFTRLRKRPASAYVAISSAHSAVGYVWLRRTGHRLARYLPATVVGAFVFGAVTKWLVSRPRPRGRDYGLPSGHTLGATIFFGGVIYLLWTSPIPRVWRWVGTAL